MDMFAFGARLRQARKQAGMSGADAAFMLHTDQSMVSRYETGCVYPTIERVASMASLYGVSIDWLCGFDGGTTDEG